MNARADGPPGSPYAARALAGLAGLRRRLRPQAGFTLVELLIATTLAIVVIGGPMTFIVVSLKQQNVASSRAFDSRQAAIGLNQLTRDLREAQAITNSAGVNTTPVAISNSAGVATLSFYLPTAGSTVGTVAGSSVTWTCTPGASCTRKLGAAAAVPEIRGVTAATFSGTTTTGTATTANPANVAINIQVQVTSLADTGQTHTVTGSSNPIILQDGVALRNYS